MVVELFVVHTAGVSVGGEIVVVDTAGGDQGLIRATAGCAPRYIQDAALVQYQNGER